MMRRWLLVLTMTAWAACPLAADVPQTEALPETPAPTYASLPPPLPPALPAKQTLSNSKKAAMFAIGTIAALTIGLYASSADHGKRAPSGEGSGA